jgi:anti-anti-sigma factor
MIHLGKRLAVTADLLELTAERQGPRTRLAVRGDLHLRTRDQLIRAVLTALEQASTLELDLTGVGFCDSMGISALIASRNLAALDEKRIVIGPVSPAVEAILRVSGLLGALTEDEG